MFGNADEQTRRAAEQMMVVLLGAWLAFGCMLLHFFLLRQLKSILMNLYVQSLRLQKTAHHYFGELLNPKINFVKGANA